MRFVVYGCGKTGASVIDFLAKGGFDVLFYDDKESSMLEMSSRLQKTGRDSKVEPLKIQGFEFQPDDCLVLSPGVSKYDKTKLLVTIANKGKAKICSALDVFQKHFPNSIKIGITGTCGKSTTTMLLYHIMNNLKMDVAYGGNIGVPYFEISPIDSKYKVLELSSYELENSVNVSLRFVVITNLHKHHIEHHKTFKRYVDAKVKSIGPSSTVFLDADDLGIKKNIVPALKERYGSAFVERNINFFSVKKKLKSGMSMIKNRVFKDGALLGKLEIPAYLQTEHNRRNLLACMCVLHHEMHFSLSRIGKAIETFVGLPHRNEPCGNIDNVFFINDSKSTNYFALETCLMSFDGNVCLVAGGKVGDGMRPYKIPSALDKKVLKVFLIGEASLSNGGSFIRLGSEGRSVVSKNLEQAVRDAMEFVVPIAEKDKKEKYYIVLSPGFQSFDQFKNFEDRGDQFKKIVKLMQPC